MIERNYWTIKQWRGLGTRYDKHTVVYRAAVIPNAVPAWSRLPAEHVSPSKTN
ncbi:hypothetical protein [Corynebacterium kalidii]